MPEPQAQLQSDIETTLRDVITSRALLGEVLLRHNSMPHSHTSILIDATEDVLKAMEGELSDLAHVYKKGDAQAIANVTQVRVKGNYQKSERNEYDVTELKEEGSTSFRFYRLLFNKMATHYENGAGAIVGTPFQDLVLESALRRRSVFIEKSGKTKMEHIGASVQEDYSAFLLKAQEAFAIDPEKLMRKYLTLLESVDGTIVDTTDSVFPSIPSQQLIPPMQSFKPRGDRGLEPHEQAEAELMLTLKRMLHDAPDWGEAIGGIAEEIYKSKSMRDSELLHLAVYGNPMEGYTFVVEPKQRTKKIALADLVGYDKEKGLLQGNIESMIAGNDANHVYIHGPPGTGKSSVINALLTQYASQGLRVLEIMPEAIGGLKTAIAQVRNSDYKFIILLDEFKIGGNRAVFDFLKKTMEGSFEEFPRNGRIYAISNVEKGARLGFRQDEDQDVDEMRSLEDRFGLRILFGLPNEKTQKDILTHHLKEQRVTTEAAEAYKGLLQFCANRKIDQPNPRNIRDYVKTLQPARSITVNDSWD